MRQSGVPARHRAHLQPRPASPPGSLCGRARYESSPGRVGTDRRGAQCPPRPRGDSPPRARRLTAAAKPLQLGGGKRLGDAQGCPPRARLGAGARVTRWTPTKVRVSHPNHSWVTDSPPRGQVGGWRGLRRAERQRPARGGTGAGAHVTAEREMGGSLHDSALPVCIQAPRPGAPLERGALGGATKHTGACPQRSHVGAGRRCTDLGAERD